MTVLDRSPDEATPARRLRERAERYELLGHLQSLLEPLMAALGLAFLVLLLIDFSGIDLTPGQRLWLDRAMTGIWAIFVVDFVTRFVVAPSKPAFLRSNWLAAASLALPFLRPFRALQAARAVRSLSLVRFLGGANRGMRVLQQVARGRQLAYVGALTILVTLMGAIGVLYFDRNAEGATIRTFGDALWWSAAMVTTINNEKYAVTAEARVIAVLQRLFAVSVFGFVTASIASYFVGQQARPGANARPDADAAAERLAALREENAALRRDLAGIRAALERLAADRVPPDPADPANRPADRLLAGAMRDPAAGAARPSDPGSGS